MIIKNYFLSFEAWLKEMEKKHEKITAICVGVWVFCTFGLLLKSIEIYSEMWHTFVGFIFNFTK